jgi:hypothetical protein
MRFTLVGLWVFPILTGELAPVFPCPQLAAGFTRVLRDRPTFACSQRAGPRRLPPALPARRAPRLRRHTTRSLPWSSPPFQSCRRLCERSHTPAARVKGMPPCLRSVVAGTGATSHLPRSAIPPDHRAMKIGLWGPLNGRQNDPRASPTRQAEPLQGQGTSEVQLWMVSSVFPTNLLRSFQTSGFMQATPRA